MPLNNMENDHLWGVTGRVQNWEYVKKKKKYYDDTIITNQNENDTINRHINGIT